MSIPSIGADLFLIDNTRGLRNGGQWNPPPVTLKHGVRGGLQLSPGLVGR